MTSDATMEFAEYTRTGLASEEALASSRRVWRAIEDEDAFGMVFQPIVTLSGREIVGAEALARFAGPPTQPPNSWFEEAAAVSLGVDLELVAVEKALDGMLDFPPEVYLSVNVSPATLVDPSFRRLVSRADPSRLVLELTEHHRVADYDCLAKALDEVRASGMRMAIDDVGAGFASLRHILKLRPELIKLDLSLIREINLDQSKQALAASLISFAEKSGATIIAEGIETAQELSTLVRLGVGYGQGLFLGCPVPRLFTA